MADVEYSSRAADWLRDADPDAQERVIKKIDPAVTFPEDFLSRLSGSEFYKLRAGDYRVIVDWRRADDLLFVRRIGHRRNVYD